MTTLTQQLSTTFALAHRAKACSSSYKRMGKALGGITNFGGDTPFTLEQVLDVCGLSDALWCLRCTLPDQEAETHRVLCLFLADCLERIEDHMADARSRAVIPLLRRRAAGQATDEEMADASHAAYAAAYAAAEDAADEDAADAAAAYAAAEDAADAAAAAYAAAEDAADDERKWQAKRLRQYLTKED